MIIVTHWLHLNHPDSVIEWRHTSQTKWDAPLILLGDFRLSFRELCMTHSFSSPGSFGGCVGIIALIDESITSASLISSPRYEARYKFLVLLEPSFIGGFDAVY